MKRSIVPDLIFKDWQLQRLQIILTIAAGLAALLVITRGGEVPFVLGTVWFFVSLIVLASMLPMASIINERKKQNIAFLMSLPVSPIEYTTAKMISTFASFLVPWLLLVAAALSIVVSRHLLPYGTIPVICILALLPLVGFVFITGMTLVGESEGWGIAGNLVCNSSYWLVWYLLMRNTSLANTWKSNVAVWNQTTVTIVSCELAIIAVVTGLTLFLQSRKRDFV